MYKFPIEAIAYSSMCTQSCFGFGPNILNDKGRVLRLIDNFRPTFISLAIDVCPVIRFSMATFHEASHLIFITRYQPDSLLGSRSSRSTAINKGRYRKVAIHDD